MSDNDLKTNDLDLNDPKDFNGEAPEDINENDSLPDEDAVTSKDDSGSTGGNEYSYGGNTPNNDAMYKAAVKKHTRTIIIEILVISSLINGGFFPIINLNPDNPVDIGLLRLFLIAVAVAYQAEAGSLESLAFAKSPMIKIWGFNLLPSLIGMVCRYFIEFGEVSNTYNFTVPNILAQALILSLIPTVVCFFTKKSRAKKRSA